MKLLFSCDNCNLNMMRVDVLSDHGLSSQVHWMGSYFVYIFMHTKFAMCLNLSVVLFFFSGLIVNS